MNDTDVTPTPENAAQGNLASLRHTSDLLTGDQIGAFDMSGDRETPHTTKPGRARDE